MLKVENLSVHYGAINALRNISFSVNEITKSAFFMPYFEK